MDYVALDGARETPKIPQINDITLDHPWRWLEAGWRDLRRAPQFSISYGAFFVLVSYLLTLGLFNGEMFFLVPPVAAGFFLVAPMLGVGLYQISRNNEQNQEVHFCQARDAWNSNPVHLSAMCVVLVFIMLLWMLAANLVFALFFTQPMPTWENFIPVVFLSGDNIGFVLAGIFSGAFIALFTFSISVVTAPMLMDRQTDVMTAMKTSFQATIQNWRPMLLWASLIAMFVGIGIFTFYLGLLVAMPLVGHATWHAYRDLVPRED
jgi:uncharacterized membrane protein